jgi:hypothetical protein
MKERERKRRMKEIIRATESERGTKRNRDRRKRQAMREIEKERKTEGTLKETNNKIEIETFRSVE